MKKVADQKLELPSVSLSRHQSPGVAVSSLDSPQEFIPAYQNFSLRACCKHEAENLELREKYERFQTLSAKLIDEGTEAIVMLRKARLELARLKEHGNEEGR